LVEIPGDSGVDNQDKENTNAYRKSYNEMPFIGGRAVHCNTAQMKLECFNKNPKKY